MGPCSTRGCPGGPTMWADDPWARPSLGRAWVAPRAHQAPHMVSFLTILSLSWDFTPPLLKPVFLLFLIEIFDLLAQPIFSAEIWIICSPVCDSSDYPIKILNGLVYLEYFAAVGDLFSELACLFMNLLISFCAWFSSLLVPIVLSMNFMLQNQVSWGFVKNFRIGRWIG